MTEKRMVFLVAEDVLKEMFETKEKEKSKSAKILMDKMKELKDRGQDIIIKTPQSHFLRAIFLADPDTPIQNIQKVLSFTEILPSKADFKNQQECIDEMVEIASKIGVKDE